jgi:hypothetical protein
MSAAQRNGGATMESSSFLRMSVAILLVFLTAAACATPNGSSMAIGRISVIDARKMMKTGNAILVCSYDDNRCKQILLEGAMLRSEFEAKSAAIPKTQPIIFY